MHHDVFDLLSFSIAWRPFDDFSRRLFFYLWSSNLPIFREFHSTFLFFGKPVLINSHLQKLKLYSASCLLLVVCSFRFFHQLWLCSIFISLLCMLILILITTHPIHISIFIFCFLTPLLPFPVVTLSYPRSPHIMLWMVSHVIRTTHHPPMFNGHPWLTLLTKAFAYVVRIRFSSTRIGPEDYLWIERWNIATTSHGYYINTCLSNMQIYYSLGDLDTFSFHQV